MTRPLLGLIVGLLWVVYGLLSYRGHSLLRGLSPFLVRPGNLLWLAGHLLLAVAAGLGMAGYLLEVNLRIARIVAAILGVALLLLA